MKAVDEFFEEMEERFYGVDMETVRRVMRVDGDRMLEVFEDIAVRELMGDSEVRDGRI